MSDREPKVSCFGPFSFDPATGELHNNGARFKLHPQPAQVFSLLLKRAGEVVTREEIRKEIWGDETHVDFDQSINSCIRQIRTALDDDADHPVFIQTIPRKGYRFVAPVDFTEGKPKSGGSTHRVWLTVMILTVITTLGLWSYVQRSSEERISSTQDDRLAMAVFPFTNLEDDSSTDWLRLGLSEMLVTDLAQSPHIAVLSTDRLFRILQDTGRGDERSPSFESIQKVAELTGVEMVVIGSFVKAGEILRIDVRMQESRTGKIISTERVEAKDESRIFAEVDELTQRIKSNFQIPRMASERDLEEVVTSSPEAFRYYAEARKLRNLRKDEESIPLLEKALEIDSGFVMALINIINAHWNLAHFSEAERYTQRAIALDELTDHEKLDLKARLSSFRQDTYREAIEAYEELGEPGGLSARLWWMERYQDCIQVLERVRKQQFGAPYLRQMKQRNLQPYEVWTSCLTALGELDKARELVREAIDIAPDSGYAYFLQGNLFLFQNRPEFAIGSFDKAESFIAGYSQARNGRWWAYVILEQLDRAAQEAESLTDSSDPSWKWQGRMNQALQWLYEGKTRQALSTLEQAIAISENEGRFRGLSRNLESHVLTVLGRWHEVLESARQAQRDDIANPPEWQGLYQDAIALAKLGRYREAEQVAARLEKRTRNVPSSKETRRHRHLMGELYLEKGDLPAAVANLEKAQSLLPPGHSGHTGVTTKCHLGPIPHVPIWFSLATAYLESGNEGRAIECLERITGAGVNRVEWPIPYVRSFYFLGNIHEQRGDMEQAHEYYRRFYEYWKDGDLDRDRVEEARRFLDSI